MKKFIITINKLKEIERSGWVERGIKKPESTADHSFMTALFCMTFANKNINKEKAIKMALVHDLAESLVGDIITTESWQEGGKMPEKEKIKLEESAMNKLMKLLNTKNSNEIMKLWNEFEEQKTKEAKFVRDIDVADMIIQAKIYHRKKNYKKPLQGFWDEKSLSRIRNKNIRKFVEMF